MNIETEGYRLMNKETGEYYPWYTHPTLEWLDTLDLSEKVVFEYGIGDSSLWWAKRCKKLYGVESNPEWVNKINSQIGDVAVIECNENYLIYDKDWNPTNFGDDNLYIRSIFKHGTKFDIIIIDGLDREECVEPAIKSLSDNGIIIYDNWMQPSVTVQSEETQKRLLAFKHEIYHQPGHEDWKTAVFFT